MSFQYSSLVPASELLAGVVGDFVQRSLAGSLSPFVTYLSEAEDVSEEELQQLQDVVARLQSRKQRKE